MKRGTFILFEGIDRCGKSTQSKLLAEHLLKNGIKVESMRFPERTTAIGGIINLYLSNTTEVEDKAIHLLFSANRWEAKNKIYELLNSGTTIVCDRYAYSGVAFTATKDIDLDWCKSPDIGLPKPDIVIYIKLEIEEAMKRGDFGNERYEKIDFQKKVKEIFETKLMDETWKTIDGTKSVEDIHKNITNLAGATISNSETKPIETLWE